MVCSFRPSHNPSPCLLWVAAFGGVLVVIGLALILGTLKLLRDRNRIAQETNDLLARHVPCSDRSGPAMGIPRRPENAAEGKCKLTVGPGPPTVRDVRAVRIDRAVALYLNRRLWPFTALNSWTGGLSIGLHSWKHCT